MDIKRQVALKQMRTSVADLLQPKHGDHELLRWLIARDFNVEKAVVMFKNHVAWRRSTGMDTILEDYTPHEIFTKYVMGDPRNVLGYDKCGSEIFIFCRGRMDFKGLLRSVAPSELLKYIAYVMEVRDVRRRHLREEKSQRSEQFVDILDLEGFGMHEFWKPGIDIGNKLMNMVEANYPEQVKQVFIINAPAIFPVLFAIVNRFLSEMTRRKIKVFGRTYQSELLKYIDSDQLPVKYGGTKTGPSGDPTCSQIICYGGKIPAEYYVQMDPEKLDGFSELSVKRGSSIQLEYNVEIPNSILRWRFVTEGFDVGFGVLMKTEKDQALSDMTVIMETIRVSSHLVPEDGCVTCDLPGKYILHFDNTYSWARAKKILYVADVLEPSIDIEILECTHL